MICFGCGQFGHRRDACSMIDTRKPTDVDCAEPHESAKEQSQVVEDPLKPEFGPWIIVQRKTRRPAKEAVDKVKSKTDPNQSHDFRNRFQSLRGVKDSGAASKDHVVI